MTKKRKDKKRKPNTQNKIQTVPSDEKRKIQIESLFFSITILILLITVFGKYVNDPNVSLLFGTLWKTSVAILVGLRMGGNQVIIRLITTRKTYTDLLLISKYQKALRVISIIIIAIIVFPSIYYSPVREQISIFLVSIQVFSKNVADNISNIVSAILATISGFVGNILLGALGNLLYDFAKNYYTKLRPKRNNK